MVSMTCLALVFHSLNNVLNGTQFSSNGFFTLDFLIGTATPIATMSRRIGRLADDNTNDRLAGTDTGPGDLYEIYRSTGAQTLILAATFFHTIRATDLRARHTLQCRVIIAALPFFRQQSCPPLFPNPQPSPPSASAASESAPSPDAVARPRQPSRLSDPPINRSRRHRSGHWPGPGCFPRGR